MKKELLNGIGPAVVIFGFLLVLGAVGASDCGTYTIGQALCQVGLGFAVIAVGAAISILVKDIMNEKKEDK